MVMCQFARGGRLGSGMDTLYGGGGSEQQDIGCVDEWRATADAVAVLVFWKANDMFADGSTKSTYGHTFCDVPTHSNTLTQQQAEDSLLSSPTKEDLALRVITQRDSTVSYQLEFPALMYHDFSYSKKQQNIYHSVYPLLWATHTTQSISLTPGESISLSLTAFVTSPGVYDISSVRISFTPTADTIVTRMRFPAVCEPVRIAQHYLTVRQAIIATTAGATTTTTTTHQDLTTV